MPADLLEQPHHDGAGLHVAEVPARPGATVPVFLRVPHGDGATQMWVRTTPDAEPSYIAGSVDRTTASEVWWRCDIPIHNTLTGYRFLLAGGRHGYRWLNGAGVHFRDVTDGSDFRLTAAPPAPRWARDAVVYQIFPDRFARSEAADGRATPDWAVPAAWDDPVIDQGPDAALQFYGGDLDGVAGHLDHIASIGADLIYLTPVFPAPSNHRYNASTFAEVDPLLGGDKALVRLAQEVHGRGWKIVGDLTTNHCGATHHWFQAALADPAAPEREFFYFTPSGAYVSWFGHPTLPKFRHASGELSRLLIDGPDSVAGRWLRPPYDLDGWRVDVANMTGRQGTDDLNAAIARTLRTTVDRADRDAVLIAEHCHDASADLIAGGWHGAMNYAGFARPVWAWLQHPDSSLSLSGQPVAAPRTGAEGLYATMRDFWAAAPWTAMTSSWSLISSHDSARIRTITADPDVVEVAAGLLFTMPGTPMVYAGDEIGLTGSNGEHGREPFPWNRPDRWDRSTLRAYRSLARLRKSHDALRRGGLRWAYARGDALVFLRESAHERLLIFARRASHEPVRLRGRSLGLDGEAANLYGGAAALRAGFDNYVTLPGDGPTFQVWQLA